MEGLLTAEGINPFQRPSAGVVSELSLVGSITNFPNNYPDNLSDLWHFLDIHAGEFVVKSS